MSNQIQFNAYSFKSNQVRVITDIHQEPWFCANDVCAILEYANPRQAVQKNCNPKGVSIRDTLTKGGKQEMVYINEPNLYRLIIKSRKPEAEPFEAWVFEEVLPQIRKTGKYSSEQQQLALPEPQDNELLQLLMRIYCYGTQYADYQRAALGTAHNDFIGKSKLIGDFCTEGEPAQQGYLFVFTPNIEKDLQQAREIINRHVKAQHKKRTEF
ncbi:Putative Prophage antirepressor [Avibacterium paragallinarum JF4211]|uniref:Prophage antirepressor n=3 Tax=Avibacterium paragallinarum TaxID=728 RepID=A0A377ICF2_AVIPA|nr:Bro-N domain-containing protein [Avibacterium paragallinarum]CDF98625.1 Putative Prophage antirepressor [Avibacterium paragallinarum JF4211]STO73004.1 prophage antirepressor [Avibacterium paragallinarum]